MSRALVSLLVLAAGCSLPRAAIGAGLDARVTGTDAAVPPGDAWVAPGTDAAMPVDASLPDAGGCHDDGDCPADTMIEGMCSYADTCATTAPDPMSRRTHYACVDHVCTPMVTELPTTCARETDGDPCGSAPTCGSCSATACGGMGNRMCSGPMCLGGVCQSTMTVMPCTTPDDMCGSLSDWSFCYYSPSRGRCVQTRSWGACVLGVCIGGTGQTEARDCTC